ncbi:MAG: hypothetical protein JHD35_08285 [Sphingopyxis sp.]|nr:hypothetical protein [Sphingopyxis sp.]
MTDTSRILSRRTAGRELTDSEISKIAGSGGFSLPGTFSPDSMTYVGSEGNVKYYEPDDCTSDM